MKGKMKGLTPGLVVRVNDRAVFSAKMDEQWVDATIVDLLAAQFTALIGTKLVFRMYQDKGATWDLKKEEHPFLLKGKS